jgi:hypothetical protein
MVIVISQFYLQTNLVSLFIKKHGTSVKSIPAVKQFQSPCQVLEILWEACWPVRTAGLV